MGFNAGLAIIDGATIGDLDLLGVGLSGRLTSGEEILFRSSIAVQASAAVELPAHRLLVADHDMLLGLFRPETAARLGKRVVALTISNTTDTFALEVNGSRGQERLRVRTHGEDVEEMGTPLPEERDLGTFDEDGCLDLLERVTAVSVADLLRREFVGIEVLRPAPPPRLTRRFRRLRGRS